jgi:hypothetical protein
MDLNDIRIWYGGCVCDWLVWRRTHTGAATIRAIGVTDWGCRARYNLEKCCQRAHRSQLPLRLIRFAMTRASRRLNIQGVETNGLAGGAD